MKIQKELQFKISSALKNIIGSDLINDDFIAVFELVKNSFDAHATRVDVLFENIYSENPKIIILDNGKGMNYDDLINKWLFVAYSAKKDGTEEDSYKDYRDRIKTKRAYAGAKGIGRFSCDRLGNNLLLETIKDEVDSKVEILLTDWSKFEEDLKDEFINISVLHESVDKGIYNLKKGTVLEITNLKSEWNRNKIIELKNALARLINPNSINEEDDFKIFVTVEEELVEDNKQIEKNKKLVEKQKLDYKLVDYFNTINGEVKNLIFDVLNVKTSFIKSIVADKKITTSLFEAGKLVYKIEEKNLYADLKDVEYSVYFLNQSAKATFTKRMGVEPVNYGHVFVYKNGLRIFPYGERGEDPLKMDNRKAQGHSRYLGTREVIGFISINGINNNLRETSSRGDGLIKTNTYFELEACFYEALKKLERYNLEITDWGNFLSKDEFINLNEKLIKNKGFENEKTLNVNENLEKFIKNLTRGNNIISFEISDEILSILNKKTENSAKTILSEITNKIQSDDFNKNEVIQTIKSVEKKLDNLQKSKQEAEEEAFQKGLENEKLSKELDEEISKKLFDTSINNRDKKDLLTLQHQIVHTAGNITFSLDELVKMVNGNISKEKIIEEIVSINLEVKKILSVSRFVTNAGFSIESEKITEDLVQFCYEYVKNNYLPINSFIHQKKPIKIDFDIPNNLKKILKFRPLEITVLLDNLFSNSKKANAKKIVLSWSRNQNNIVLSFIDDGDGIPTEIKDKIFEFGYTKTNGSGIGLFQVQETLKRLGGSILVNTDLPKGVQFLVKFPI